MRRRQPDEVLEKLGQANEWAKSGLSQAEICAKLGISVMTFHRWRKLQLRQFDGQADANGAPEIDHFAEDEAHKSDIERLAELQLENQQLRKIVSDLMLEKLRAQESLAAQLDRQDRRKLAAE